MTKVAILISGQPRNFELGYKELYTAYLSKYDCDVYLHTWEESSFNATHFDKSRPAHSYVMTDDWEQRLTSLYKPVVSNIQPPIVFDPNKVVDPLWRQPLQNTLSMWYSVQQAHTLTTPGYDVYIRTRFDLKYEPALLNLDNLDLTKLHIWDWDTDQRVKHRGYYDVFAIGTYDTIGIYSSLYTKIGWYLNYDLDYKKFLQGGWPGQDSGLRNEYLLRWHLMQSGVPVEEHPNTIPHADGQIIR